MGLAQERLYTYDDYMAMDDDTVVQPDITIVYDMSKLDPRGTGGCNGVPDMVLEIISPSSKQMDRLTKFQVYQKFGVREYWLVDPATKTVDVNILTNGKYVKTTYNRTDTVPVRVLEGCEIALADVFEEIREL